ncbi:putative N-acetyltransferase YhbS [Flavobacterium sp. 90]|uniref:GNAT family N-acetyltransferase n=1 Tax=unclassified Flavobacterium TaxID=196869 RepID=UPI000F1B6D20|nr:MULTISPECIES: N-acetyltransferase [unclassified Flavobacterium]RKR08673.1 putative N-acetyltransferase YhbS [Flavobacterium sp. 81]TCK52460.1 putative N-acetyltransferase YhbS [Flavobacterium sp. 90]
MEIKLRRENEKDHKSVFQLIEKAFENEEYSDHKEQFLVERLRKSDAFIPELSIVAEVGNEIVGHILLTKLEIKNDTTSFESLALAPVSVLPEFQGKGIGSKLILYSHKIAKELGYKSIILLGHQDYYPRFGYELTNKYGIEMPFDVPAENCMVIALTENGLSGVNGKVVYATAFFE